MLRISSPGRYVKEDMSEKSIGNGMAPASCW